MESLCGISGALPVVGPLSTVSLAMLGSLGESWRAQYLITPIHAVLVRARTQRGSLFREQT